MFRSSFQAVWLLLLVNGFWQTAASTVNSPIPSDSFLTCSYDNQIDCMLAELDPLEESGHPPSLRGLSIHFHAEFNTIPPGGWSEWTEESGGLEWLWASPVAVTGNYYEYYPDHTNHNLTCNENRFSSDNFPDSIRLSGFRLPTMTEVENSKPLVPPTCMARYINNGAHWCDEYDYSTNALVTLDQSCKSGCCDTIFVRPVGTPDVPMIDLENIHRAQPCYGIGDIDGDGICDDVDNCVETPNPLQGYAFSNADAECSDLTIELDQYGIAELFPDEIDNGASDRCSADYITSGRTEFRCSDVGASVNEYYSLEDKNGNVGGCTANITVVDKIAPYVQCKNISVYLDSNGVLNIDDPSLVHDGSHDACGIDWIQVTPSLFGCEDVHEPQPLVVSVMDNNGNVAFCDAEANIINEPPEWMDGIDSITVLVGSDAVNLFVDVVDPEDQPLSYEWGHSCDDEAVDAIFYTDSSSNEASIHFPHGSKPKRCDVNVEVCDICGSCMIDTTEIILVDPEAGSITGAGWYESPKGAYVEDITSSGTISFGFVAEYRQGQQVPTGEFQLFAPNFDFYSTSYEWLMVGENPCANLHGHGLMYGKEEEYTFSLIVCDGDDTGGEYHDEIVVKIWSALDGEVVYDNGDDEWGEYSYEDATQVRGGNVQVRKHRAGKS